MVRHIDAIFSHGVFRPVEPLALPEGTRVQLSVEEHSHAAPLPPAAKTHAAKLARAQDAGDFALEVRESGDAEALR